MPNLDAIKSAMPSRLSDDPATDPFEDAKRAFELYRDGTGTQYVQPTGELGLFEKDPDRVPPILHGSDHVNLIAEMQDRRKLVKALADIGADPVTRLVDAIAVHDAIVGTTLVPNVPNVMTLSVKDAGKAVAEYADQLARISTAKKAVDGLKIDAYRRIVRTCNDSLSDVLSDPAVRAEFDDAAKLFTESYPLVRECRSIADAAGADDTGAGVAAWHTAKKAVARMDAVVDLVAGFAAPEQVMFGMPTSFRARLGSRRVLGISAAPVDSADLFRALADHGIDGPKAPKGYAWSL